MRQPIDEDLNVELPDLADVSASSFQREKGKNISPLEFSQTDKKKWKTLFSRAFRFNDSSPKFLTPSY